MLASAVLGGCLRRLPADHLAVWGQPVLAVETFTDPARHAGSCYAAAGFSPVGTSAGYARNRGTKLRHGRPKVYWVRPLHRHGLTVRSGDHDRDAGAGGSARGRQQVLRRHRPAADPA